jgi:hypothetical protein
LAATLKVNVVPLAVLGPLFEYSTVPVTGWPAFSLAGKLSFAATSAMVEPAMVAVAVLLARLGSVVVLEIEAVTTEVPEAG